jgi:hypothetical protein
MARIGNRFDPLGIAKLMPIRAGAGNPFIAGSEEPDCLDRMTLMRLMGVPNPLIRSFRDREGCGNRQRLAPRVGLGVQERELGAIRHRTRSPSSGNGHQPGGELHLRQRR